MATTRELFLKKSCTVDIQLGSKYASVNITLHLTFLRRTKFMESWWNFLSFYLKKIKIWEVSIKVFQQSWKPATLLAWNRRLQCIFTSKCFFYRTTPVAASIKELFLLPRHDNSTRDKEISQSHMNMTYIMTSVPPDAVYWVLYWEFPLYFKINKKISLVKQIFWSYMHLSISLYNMMIEIQFLIQKSS